MAIKFGTLLTDVMGIHPSVSDRLSLLWITTAEELLSAANQTNGKASLTQYLNLPDAEIDALIVAAGSVVPEGISFADDDIELALGCLPLENVANPDDEPAAFMELPNEIDLRNQMPPIRDQAGRSTCVAHATAAVREYLLGPDSQVNNLSEQFIYWACKQRDGHRGPGTWIRVAMDVLCELGVCPETTWTYNPNQVPNNESQGPPPADAERDAGLFKVKSCTELNARWVDSLREVLADGSPIAFSVFVFQSMQRPNAYRGGDVHLPLPGERKLGGHAMCMVGYVDDQQVPGGGYFIVRNSWGEPFGYYGEVAPGYCRIPYDYIRQYGMEAFVAYID